MLIGCDVLRQHSAIIDLSRGIVSLTSEDGIWMAELMDANRASSIRTNYHVSENYYCRDYTPQEGIRYEENNQELWRSKLEEIRTFRREKTSPIVAVPKKNGKVRICLDAREINKMIINDRTSPGEIEEILKKFNGTKFISTWDTVLSLIHI